MPRLVSCLLVVLLLWLGGTPVQAEKINANVVITGTLNAGTATGASNAYALALPFPITAYVTNQCFTFKANHTNTGASTLAIDGLAAKALKKYAGGVLIDVPAGTLTSGQQAHVCYDGTVMQVMGASGDPVTDAQVPDLSTLSTGLTGSRCVETAADGHLTVAAGVCGAGGGGSSGFNAITSGINTTAAMVVSTGASLTPSGSGTIAATTAVALATNPADCAAGTYATTIAANGDLTCTQPVLSQLSGTASTAQLADDAVTFAKLQNISTATFVGRATSGTGDPEELNATAAKTILALNNVDNTSDATKNNAAAILANKQLVPRYVSPTITSNILTPNCDTTDVVYEDSIAADFTIAAPTCTGSNPVNGQELTFRLKTSAPRAITWDPAYSAENGLPLPTTTTGDGATYDWFRVVRNATSAKWGLLASSKGVQRGVTTLGSSTTYTVNVDLASQSEMQMTGVAGTLTIAAPTGTPKNGQLVMMGFLCTNIQTLSWASIFLASPNIALPTTCPANVTQWTFIGFRYSSVLTKWQILAVN